MQIPSNTRATRNLRRTWFAGLFITFFVLSGCSVELLTKSRFLDFDFNGPVVHMSSGGVRHSLDISPYASASGDYGYQVLLINRQEGFIYAVLEVTGRSPGRNDACTNGLEKNVVWMKLNRKLELQDVKTVLVESCPQNVRNPGGCVVTDERLTVDYFVASMAAAGGNFSTQNRAFQLRYDNRQPKNGLTILQFDPKTR